MITKKQYKRIAKGDYGALMDGIEDLINTLNSDVFDEGYNACIMDMDILSARLAEYIHETAKSKGHKEHDFDDIYYLEQDELLETIKQFYKERLNGKD
jgi:hypothetical protein